jgi:DNA-binding NarL/FixJ family response regulator
MAALTERELQVVTLVVDGLTDQEIAVRLGVSRRTVHGHVGHAMQKTATATRTQLAVYALRNGLAPLNPRSEIDA